MLHPPPTLKPWLHGNLTSFHAAIYSSYGDEDPISQSLKHNDDPNGREPQSSTTTTDEATKTIIFSAKRTTASLSTPTSTSYTAFASSPTTSFSTPASITEPAVPEPDIPESTSTMTSSSVPTPTPTTLYAAVIYIPDTSSTQNPTTKTTTTTIISAPKPPLPIILTLTAVTKTTQALSGLPFSPILLTPLPPPTINLLTTTNNPTPSPQQQQPQFQTPFALVVILISYVAISCTVGFLRCFFRKIDPASYAHVGPAGEMSGAEMRRVFRESFLWPVWPCVLVWKGRWGKVEFVKRRKGHGGMGKQMV
ncbi:hypothetical protein QBC44DRAFT_372198 [Cladorrhinum sp. PSN332]|nr:hypothetical protein QBC44DRAFT_372198 [Cladorrhinum sp. PSN332]